MEKLRIKYRMGWGGWPSWLRKNKDTLIKEYLLMAECKDKASKKLISSYFTEESLKMI